MKKNFSLFSNFYIPITVLIGILLYILGLYKNIFWSHIFAVAVILFGSFTLIKETVLSIFKKQFALDYIAIMAIFLSVFTGQYLIGLVIVLMFSGGNALENYGMTKAKQSLTALTDRIPHEVVLWNDGAADVKKAVEDVGVGTKIIVRKGEVVPLDGVLITEEAITDESSLTGEPYVVEKLKGDQIRSGTINVGDVLVIEVTKRDNESTYYKIVEMVRRAQEEKSPFIRLADRYSTVFTILTAIISVAAYFISHDINRVLAVLVVATPCPLILATPIALFGGMNSAAKKRILIKKISSLEVLSRCSAVVLDKTGTITLGQPEVTRVNLFDKKLSEREVYSIAEAIERNSLHPLAKAIIAKANEVGAKHLPVQKVSEKIGLGISAFINGKTYTLAKMGKYHHSNAIELHEEENLVAIFEFEDKLKTDSSNIISELKRLGLELYIFTGDRDENARKILEKLGKETSSGIIVRSGFSPEDKKNGIQELKKNKRIVAMIGDGINDAPALAIADVGMVFSNEEQTAASEAADVVFLGGSLSSITFIINNAKKTIRIALESILFGIGLSIVAMIFAAIGYIPPLFGAILQEIIDIIVIINALRASK